MPMKTETLVRPVRSALEIALIFLVIIFIFAGLLLVASIFHNPATGSIGGATAKCQALGVAAHSQQPVSAVGVSWMRRMQTDGSQIVAVSLSDMRGAVPAPTVAPAQQSCGTPTAAPVTSTPIERPQAGFPELAPSASAIGTPGVALAGAFGSSYDGSATANLEAVGFNSVPTTPAPQPLDQSEITWDWDISPTTPGRKYAIVTVDGTWTPKSGHGPVIRRQIWQSPPMLIDVAEPLFQRNPFDLLTFLTGTSAASSLVILALRWLLGRLLPQEKAAG